MADAETLLTPEQVAERMQVDRKTIYRWLADGKLPALKIGRTYRIDWSDVKAMIRRQDGKSE